MESSELKFASTAHYPYDPYFKERSKLDEEIHELEERLHLLKVKRNSLLPVSNIPTDVLIDIFQLAIARPDEDVSPKRIAEISWVCRLWRKAALDHPILWTEIHSSLSIPWISAFLERSKPADISIGIGHQSQIQGVVDSLIPELYRIRHLELIVGTISKFHVLSVAAPVLESMNIYGVYLPDSLFSGVTPLLRRVHLSGCDGFNFNTIPITQLTELALSHPNPKPSILDWLTQLSGLKNLESLNINDAVDGLIPSTNLPHVHLPNLRSITMNDIIVPLHIVSTFLCQISSHPNTTTLISSSDLIRQVPAYLRLLTHLQVFDPRHELSLSVSYFKINASVLKPNEDTVLTHIDAVYHWVGRVEPIDVLRQLPLQTLTSLTLMDYGYDELPVPFPRELWSETLSPLPRLRKLHLTSMYAVSFMLYMAESLPIVTQPPDSTEQPWAPSLGLSTTSSDLTEIALPFSSLRSLTLEELFSQTEAWNVYPGVAHAFYKVLQRRMEDGVGLEELIHNNFSVGRFEDVPLATCAERVQDLSDPSLMSR